MRLPMVADSSAKGALRYVAAFCVTVMLAVTLLAAAAFLPQQVIRGHIVDSIDFILYDYEHSTLFDMSPASQLDALTDTMMLRTSLATNTGYLGSVFTNPVYTYEGLEEWVDVDEMLVNQAYEMPSDGVWFYCRYWMGFRAVLRLALTLFTFAQIKRYLALLFFSLFMAVVCSVAKNANSKIAFLFAMSVVLVRPHVIATSMQFTCCFLIAFIAMLLVPWIARKPRYEALFFLEIGMITMYFDFYTVPLITFGFPLVYLYVLKQNAGENVSFRNLGRNLAVWLAGYVLMWIAKLTLTTVLTSVNALEQGFQSFAGRVGIQKDAELEQYYSLAFAWERLQEAIFSDETGRTVFLLGAAIVLAAVIWRLLRGYGSGKTFRTGAPFLVLAVIPLVWFVITKQPVAIHAFFQYRTIALTHWAGAMFLYFLLSGKRPQQPAQ